MNEVMIVEDDAGLLTAFAAVLSGEGYKTVNANSAEDAILLLEREGVKPPNVIVLDLGLPGVNGGHFLEWLRHQRSLKHIPVIVVTGAEDVHKKLESQPDRILSKPVTPDELTSAVKTALAGAK